MKNTTVTILQSDRLEDVLCPNETLIWLGQPAYGRRFFEIVEDERKVHMFVMIFIAAMWGTLILGGKPGDPSTVSSIYAFGFATILLLLLSLGLAVQRQTTLCGMLYFVTDKRCIVCRSRRNWRLETCLWAFSCPHSEAFPYRLITSHSKPSLLIGTLSLKDKYIYGGALSHAGRVHAWKIPRADVSFDYISDAQDVLESIQMCISQINKRWTT